METIIKLLLARVRSPRSLLRERPAFQFRSNPNPQAARLATLTINAETIALSQ